MQVSYICVAPLIVAPCVSVCQVCLLLRCIILCVGTRLLLHLHVYLPCFLLLYSPALHLFHLVCTCVFTPAGVSRVDLLVKCLFLYLYQRNCFCCFISLSLSPSLSLSFPPFLSPSLPPSLNHHHHHTATHRLAPKHTSTRYISTESRLNIRKHSLR